MRDLKRLCVFCGASSGVRPEYEAGATALGKQMVAEGVGLVYGGGTVGLMGVIARKVHEGLGAEGVIGVIPKDLEPREISGEMIGQLTVVDDMHQRKALMAKHADGFIAMPGGFGTLEEVLEVITWQQLGFHEKPIGILNICGFFNPLLSFFGHCVGEGFIRKQNYNIIVSSDPAELIQKMREFEPPVSLIEAHLSSLRSVGVDISQGSSDAQPSK